MTVETTDRIDPASLIQAITDLVLSCAHMAETMKSLAIAHTLTKQALATATASQAHADNIGLALIEQCANLNQFVGHLKTLLEAAYQSPAEVPDNRTSMRRRPREQPNAG